MNHQLNKGIRPYIDTAILRGLFSDNGFVIDMDYPEPGLMCAYALYRYTRFTACGPSVVRICYDLDSRFELKYPLR